MALFGLFSSKKSGSSKEKRIVPWIRLSSIEQLTAIENESFEKPVVIFKHSTRCGTSRMTLRMFESNYNYDSNIAHLYFLDLLSFRELSDEVAIRFQVMHESPQLIIIKNGDTVHHASHYRVRPSSLTKFI